MYTKTQYSNNPDCNIETRSIQCFESSLELKYYPFVRNKETFTVLARGEPHAIRIFTQSCGKAHVTSLEV
jgi:hypothetical protein